MTADERRLKIREAGFMWGGFFKCPTTGAIRELLPGDDKAFWLKVQDVTNAAFDQKVWDAAIAQIRNAGRTPIVSTELPRVVEVTVKQLALPERVTGSILTALARNGDLTQWGLSSAVTEVANAHDDYEGATELERAGGKILALDGRAWDLISKAGAAA